jgi:hypothetical protein
MNKFSKVFATFAKYFSVAGFGAGVAGVIEYGTPAAIVPAVAAVLFVLACVVLHSIKKDN